LTWVIDASVVAKWYLRESGSEAALELLTEPDLIAPQFLKVEFSNVLAKFVRRGSLKADDALAYYADLPATVSFPVDDNTLIEAALRLAMQHQHPVYDCLYVALAIRESAPLFTADRRLAERFGGLADIRLL
jgi:predicted nucleic acid-binding protein